MPVTVLLLTKNVANKSNDHTQMFLVTLTTYLLPCVTPSKPTCIQRDEKTLISFSNQLINTEKTVTYQTLQSYIITHTFINACCLQFIF